MSDPRRLGPVNVERAASATRMLLDALGYDPTIPALVDTPDRVGRAWAEVLDADAGKTTRAFETTRLDEMVCLTGITGWSFCEHHLLPFSYRAAVAYIPKLNGNGSGSTILGLSKLARIVRRHGAALQLQERMTEQIAEDLEKTTEARGVAVRISGVHLCSVMRGVKAEDAEFVTTVVRGAFMDRPEARAEFLDAARR